MTPRRSAPTAARLLARMRGRLPPAELVASATGRIVGFLLGRDGRTASQIGPLIAEDDDVAQALLARALAAIGGPIYIDLADAKTGRSRLARGCGLRGAAAAHPHAAWPRPRFDDAARTFAVVGPEFG